MAKTDTRYEHVLIKSMLDCIGVYDEQLKKLKGVTDPVEINTVIHHETIKTIDLFFGLSKARAREEDLVGEWEWWKQILSKFYARETARMFAMSYYQQGLSEDVQKTFLREVPWLELDPEGWSCHMVEIYLSQKRKTSQQGLM